jgi:hypothetical protein
MPDLKDLKMFVYACKEVMAGTVRAIEMREI